MSAVVDARRRSARADADLSAVHGRAREARRTGEVLPPRCRRAAGCRTSITCSSLVTPATRALVVIDPNNPTGAVYPTDTRRALLDFADEHGLLILADEVYGDLGFDGPVAAVRPARSRRADHLVLEPVEGVSRAGWRTGWMAIGRSPRLDDVVAAVRKLADGRLCSTVPMQYAIAPALTGDRSHQVAFRAP